jgi:hypothetical protein
MPPMTVVSPSLTSTCVAARCVSIGGMPLTCRLKSGDAFSTVMLHDHGVRPRNLRRHLQRQRGVAERHRDGVVGDGLNRNLDALRDLGFDVVLRRDARRRQDAALAVALERRQRHVEIERAVDRAERRGLAADDAGDAGRFTLGRGRAVVRERRRQRVARCAVVASP